MKRLKRMICIWLCAAMILFAPGGFPVRADGLPANTDGVPIDKEHFPDDNFRAYIRQAFDEDGDEWLSTEEINLIWNVHCENMDIYTVEGIEYFPELKGLWCKGNHISKLNLSGNPGLKGVWCSYNDFTSLDFSDCPELEWVYCFNCKLESLDVSQNKELAFLECNANPDLKELKLENNTKLENLFCSNCGLTSLNLSANTSLCELAAFYNDLEELIIPENRNLKRLDFWHNPRLGNVDVRKLPGLQYYNCAWTGLTEIDVSQNPELVELVCGYNGELKSLDLSNNPKLAYFSCECDVKLESLDFSHNPRLYYLLAFGLSSIDTIDISHNSRLCKAYQDGRYVHETENLGYVYSKTVDYGGSSDPFDELRHCVCFDDRAEIIGTYQDTEDVPDSVIDMNDGHADSDYFVTRAEAMQALYEAAGCPEVLGETRFTDVSPDAPYSDAVRWGEARKICFGYPCISSDTFCPDEWISRQDFALMAHRFADAMGLGTAFDYGRTDWFEDFFNIDFYAWGPFTWAIQWKVLGYDKDSNLCYPRGRMTGDELETAVNTIFNLEEGASYSTEVGGNEGDIHAGDWPFTDVAVRPGNWAYEGIRFAYEKGLMKGDASSVWYSTFRPKDSISRAEFLTILYRMAGSTALLLTDEPFTDVRYKANGKKPFYFDAAVWGKAVGIITGYPDGSFGGSKPISRAEIAVMLMRYTEYAKLSLSGRASIEGMPDYGKVPGYAKDAMSWAFSEGLITGREESGTRYLAPKEHAKRQECAAILQRYYDAYETK